MSGEERSIEETRVIREVYSNEDSTENFELELEGALEAGVKYIVIEPTKLGEETSRWIRVGLYLSVPSAVLCTGCATLYGISWQFDPCCKYQITTDSHELSRLNVRNLTNPSPVVLARKEDKYRKWLHNGMAILCAVYIAKTFEGILHS